MRKGFVEEKKERFRFKDALWTPIMIVNENNVSDVRLYTIKGPNCLNCGARLSIDPDDSLAGICPICDRVHKLEKSESDLRSLANIAYKARLESGLEIISLDSPHQPLIARDEDEKHWVEVRVGHASDGRKMAVVYIGDKQRSLKVQNFIDIDNEQLRTDRANDKPHEVVSKVSVEFLNSVHTIAKKD